MAILNDIARENTLWFLYKNQEKPDIKVSVDYSSTGQAPVR